MHYWSRNSLVEGDEASYRPNCETNLVIVLHKLFVLFHNFTNPTACPWSSLDKGESLACQITSPFNKKIGSFCKALFLISFAKTTQLIVEWGSYLASSSLTKELHGLPLGPSSPSTKELRALVIKNITVWCELNYSKLYIASHCDVQWMTKNALGNRMSNFLRLKEEWLQ